MLNPRCRALLWLGVLLALAPLSARASDALLQSLTPRGYVSDYAAVFSASQRAHLESRLRSVHQSTGAELAVVTLRSLEGGDIEDFAVRLFEQWGIGRRGEDNGLLLLAAIDDRVVRIEVGYGLEGTVTDAQAALLIDRVLLPRFRQGDYAGGLYAGAAAVAGLLDAAWEPLPGTAARTTGTERANPLAAVGQILFILIMIVVFIRHPFLFLLLMGGRGGGLRGGGFGGGGFGGGFGGFGGGLSGGGGATGRW